MLRRMMLAPGVDPVKEDATLGDSETLISARCWLMMTSRLFSGMSSQFNVLRLRRFLLLRAFFFFLNAEFSLLLDTGHVSVGTDDNILAVNKLRPWMGFAAAKTLGRPTMFPVIAQRSITAVLLECLLCNARMSLGMELLATQLFEDEEQDEVRLRFSKIYQSKSER